MNPGGSDDLTHLYPEARPGTGYGYPSTDYGYGCPGPDPSAAGYGAPGAAGAGDSGWYPDPAASGAVRAFGGRYELGQVLGRGGMAEVYLAQDTRLGRTVAVKTLRADLAQDPVVHARFRREAQSTASLNHPAIAAVYDTGEDRAYDAAAGAGMSLPYIVMEYVDGFTLRELLYSGRTLLPERILEIAAGILQALAYSHRGGIVHRDIKPANVMLTRAGQVKVMDFGIARDMADAGMTMTQPSAVVGTAQYLSPEQALGQQVDARSDLYSVGCLLYELLTLRPPFTGDSPMAVMYQHVQEVPQPPSLHNPGVTPELDAVVLRALAKDRDVRYQSADEMRADVEACLGWGGPAAVAVPPPVPADAGWYEAQYGDHEVVDEGEDEGEDEAFSGGGGTKSTAVLATAGVLVAAGALALGWLLFGGGPPDTGEDGKDQAVAAAVSTGVAKAEVPDVTGKDEDAAARILDEQGFKVNTRHVTSGEDPGTVLDQDPPGGDRVEKGTEITLTVARAAAESTVPDLTGATVAEAKALLAAQDLTLGSTTEVDSGAESGTVVGQSVADGQEVEPGTTVDVKVAGAVETVQVPADLVGKTLAEVRSELGDLGLDVSVASGSSGASDAVVTSSTPEPGSEVAGGSTVTVVTEAAEGEDSDSDSDSGSDSDSDSGADTDSGSPSGAGDSDAGASASDASVSSVSSASSVSGVAASGASRAGSSGGAS
ncbi:Stk1 family PASTA domain-containing Ser/Thr kinase [Streptomyces sp. NPDC058274]|uniref:Stk1 family PASTA domain-containing Ser/Thr kinase n=1 Tax=Streptomyces sp. NPDC058274 TaxID=3346416 RepID=UPI0036F156ED